MVDIIILNDGSSEKAFMLLEVSGTLRSTSAFCAFVRVWKVEINDCDEIGQRIEQNMGKG